MTGPEGPDRADRRQRVQTIFAALLDVEPEHQEQALAELCGRDLELRAEVQRLLDASRQRGFIDELAERLAGRSAASFDPRPPARLGRYDVVDKIGEGGMGVVYKARDPQLNRLVAIKLLPPDRSLDAEGRRRLLAEGRAAAALDHPAIATVYEIGEAADGGIFLAMAFYEGETLAARIARGPLPIAEAARVAREMAGGLAAAHARGITHRDLKPENVLLAQSGAVKILDFGIAKRRDADETATGQMFGTPAYMAPEQLHGANVDARADVWAFGLVLYEMLTGERLRWTGEPAAPSRLRAGVPRTLDRIVERATRLRPEERFADGSELSAALERVTGDDQADSRVGERFVRLPAPVTSFLGRQREIAEVVELLESARLLTLLGTGGTGKTRLALQVASLVRDRFEDGVCFTSLASISDPRLVCSEVARTLELPEHPSIAPVDALATFLRSRRMLLVLDNFEHVVLAAPAVAHLLEESATLQLLVTSRVPLKVAGEHEYLVPPLPHPQPTGPTSTAVLSAYPATALFLERARAVSATLTVTDDDAAAVAEICARLDGLPLAIELAAARTKLFSPRTMLSRLDRRFDLLGAGGRDRPSRHQGLRQAIAWSYDLLAPEEQALFRRLSVFVGGCSVDDAVALSEAMTPGDAGALDRCAALIDHSLVLREQDTRGHARLRMLETIREFAMERLEAAGEADAARRGHADRCLALAEQAEAHLTGPDQGEWYDRLELEHDNLRAAIGWAHAGGETDVALRFGSALWRFWASRGHLREGRQCLERLLAMPGADRRTVLRARVLTGAATLIHEISDYRSARPLAEECLSIARDCQDRPLLATALNSFGYLLLRMGDITDAEAVCEEGLALNRALDDRRGVAIALHNLGWLSAFRGDCDGACALFEESLEWRRAHGDSRGVAYAMSELAWAEIGCGRLDRAAALLRDARAALERLGDRQLLAWALTTEGLRERAAGRPSAALERFAASVELWRAVGNVFGLAFTLTGDAEAALDLGAVDRASRDLDEALPLLRQTGVCWGLGACLRACARVAELEGQRDRARALYTEALATFGRLGDAREIQQSQEALDRLAAGAAPR